LFDIVGRRRWYYLLSALLTVPGLVFVFLGGLKPSVDFTGGTVWQVRYATDPSPDAVHAALVELGHPETVVRRLSDNFLEIRTAAIGLLPPPTPIPSFSTAPTPVGRQRPAARRSPPHHRRRRPRPPPWPQPARHLPRFPTTRSSPGSRRAWRIASARRLAAVHAA
jgi:hypothetical protein